MTEGGVTTIFAPFLEKSHFTFDQIGMIFALFGITQLLARLPAGLLFGKRNASPLLAGFLLLYIASTVSFSYNGGPLYIVFWTLLHGFAFGGIGTVMLAWAIELNQNNSNHAGAMGWFTAALSAGYSIGNLSGGYLADHWGLAPVFLAMGMLPMISIGLALVIPSPRRVESQPIRDGATPLPGRGQWRQRAQFITPNLLLATLIAFYLNFLDDGFAAFFPLFGLSIGFSLGFVGLLKSIRSAVATGLRPFSGLILKRVPLGLLTNALLVVWAFAVFFTPDMHEPWALVLLFGVMGVCRGLTRVTSATMIAEERAKDSGGLGIASGIYNAGLDIGSFVGPLLAGWIASLTDIPTMFRIAPLTILAIYLAAAFAVPRMYARKSRQVPAPVGPP